MALNETIAQLYAELGRARAGQFASLGQMGAQIAQSFSPERQAERDLLSARAGLAKAELQSSQDTQRANQVLDQALQPVQPQGPQEPGAAPMTPSHPYLDDNGLIDPTKVTGLLAANGLAHMAPEMLKGIDAQNEAITKHQKLQQDVATQKAVLLGTWANTTLNLMKTGMPFDQAADHASSPFTATGLIKPEEASAQIQQLSQVPAEQQQAMLEKLRDTAAQVAPKKKLGKDETEYDIFNRPTASNIIPPTPTRASLAAAAAAGDKGAQRALDLLRAQSNPPSLEEQYLIAKTTGDTASATRILGVLTDTANAKRDPTLSALTEELRGLNLQTAKARLEELQRKNAPIDISGNVNTTMNGRKYIDITEWQTPEDRAKAQQAASALGIPTVNKDVAGMLSDLDTARQNQQTMMSLIESKLPKDAAGRFLKGPANSIEKMLQTDPELASIGTFRNAAIQSMRAVAGSKGLRINQAEVQLAIDNDIPKLSDTLDVARQKLANLSAFMDNIEKAHLVRDRSAIAGTSARPARSATELTPGLAGVEKR